MSASIPHLAFMFGLFVFPAALLTFPFVPIKRDTSISATAAEPHSPLSFADDLPKIFASFDTNNDGLLSYEEFAHGVAAKLELTQNQTERFVKLPALKEYFSDELDKNKDGQLTLEEFTADPKKSRKFAEALFNMMDLNGNGFIDYREFADFINSRMDSDAERNNIDLFAGLIFAKYDTNGDGHLDFEEFADKFSMSNTTAFTGSPLATSTATGVTKKGKSPFSKLIPAQLRIYLEQYDANGDGKWNFDEFVDMVDVVAAGSAQWKGNQTRTERLRKTDLMRRIFNAMDTDGDGQLTMQEIMAIVDAAISQDADALLSFSFKIFDKNGDGGIDFEELMELVKEWMQIADEWDEAKMEKMIPEMREKFAKVDKNGDGRLDMEELKEQYARKMAADSTNSLSPIVNSIKKRMVQLKKKK